MGSSINIEELRKIAEENSGIDINDLITQITKIKCDNLTDFEKKYLYLILCQFPADEIAFIYYKNKIPSREEIAQNKKELKRNTKTLREYASKGLNTYLKELIGLDEDTPLPQFKNGLLIKELKKVCKTNNIDKSNDEIRIVIKMPKEISKDMKDLLIQIIPSIKFE
ncbi:MAG: hypothetical protein AAFV71_23865 [Cyanobacteria bacterium J06633_8]